jgi:hypothetical protein
MEVFLIPIRSQRYELYCEIADEPAHAERPVGGWRQRLLERFTSIVSGIEAARHAAAHRRAIRQPRTLAHRLRDRVVCWMAEKIAEQRLLWHLRSQRRVTASFPDDLDEQEATRSVQQMLRADADRHLRWSVIDGLGLVASFLLVPVPGPNLLLYYFIFRSVGHYLSYRGARHGLGHVQWTMQATPALTDLRKAVTLEPEARERQVTEIASRLRLHHLAAFIERVAIPTT